MFLFTSTTVSVSLSLSLSGPFLSSSPAGRARRGRVRSVGRSVGGDVRTRGGHAKATGHEHARTPRKNVNNEPNARLVFYCRNSVHDDGGTHLLARAENGNCTRTARRRRCYNKKFNNMVFYAQADYVRVRASVRVCEKPVGSCLHCTALAPHWPRGESKIITCNEDGKIKKKILLISINNK